MSTVVERITAKDLRRLNFNQLIMLCVAGVILWALGGDLGTARWAFLLCLVFGLRYALRADIASLFTSIASALCWIAPLLFATDISWRAAFLWCTALLIASTLSSIAAAFYAWHTARPREPIIILIPAALPWQLRLIWNWAQPRLFALVKRTQAFAHITRTRLFALIKKARVHA